MVWLLELAAINGVDALVAARLNPVLVDGNLRDLKPLSEKFLGHATPIFPRRQCRPITPCKPAAGGGLYTT